MAARAVITSVPGLSLSAEARAFLRDSDPWGFILFRYNIDTPAQVHALVAQCRDAVGRNAPVLIDRGGGRVQRVAPPHWPKYPPGAFYGAVYDRDRTAGLGPAKRGTRALARDPLSP